MSVDDQIYISDVDIGYGYLTSDKDIGRHISWMLDIGTRMTDIIRYLYWTSYMIP